MRVSVIIPCYNRADLIGETLECVLNQSLPPHQVIVVDDGSTDHSVEVLRTFGERITVIEQENQGPGAARNTGFAQAIGDYIWFMDSDDLASSNKLEVQAKALEDNQADFAYGPWVQANLQDDRCTILSPVVQTQALPQRKSILQHFLSTWTVNLQFCLFRRSFLEGMPLFPTDVRICEDLDLILRVFLKGARVMHTPDCLTLYRMGAVNALTSAEKPSERYIMDQARYHLRALGYCAAHKPSFNPLAEFHFRRRLWSWQRELSGLTGENAVALQQALEEKRRAYRRETWRYTLFAHWQRYRGGLQKRLQGTRMPASYRSRPLSGIYRQIVEQLGYPTVAIETL